MTHIVAFAGSLRRDSLNRRLLRAALTHLPDAFTSQELSVDLPLFNSDLELESLSDVVAFNAAVAAADGILIATPEYNYSLPGVLKNAIDWASRPAYKSPLSAKPVGILSASMGGSGGIRAQAHLKHVLLGMAARPFAHPEFAMVAAHQKFEGEHINDEKTLSVLERYMHGFADFVG